MKVKKVQRKYLGPRQFMTSYGPCFFLQCISDEVPEEAKETFPNAKWPKKGQVYAPTNSYVLVDELGRDTNMVFFEILGLELDDKGTGHIALKFKPFPFSPN